VKQGVVVYLAGEGFNGLIRMIQAWEQFHNINIPSKNIHFSKSVVGLNSPDVHKIVRESIQELKQKPSLIIIDTLHMFFAGDENSAKYAKGVIDVCGKLTEEFGSSVLLIHYPCVSKKAQHRARGSSALTHAIDVGFSVEKEMLSNGNLGRIKIIPRKSRNTELSFPIYATPWRDFAPLKDHPLLAPRAIEKAVF